MKIRLAIALLLLAAATTAAPRDDIRWIGTWATAPQAGMPGALQTFKDQTLRLVVHTSVGGTRVRIRISNTYGDRPLVVGAAHVARRMAGPDIEPRSDRALLFGGRPEVTVPRGGSADSDGVALGIPPLSDLAVSLYLPEETPATTTHALALQQSYISGVAGNMAGAASLAEPKKLKTWPFLTGVEVDALPDGGAIVAFGDSWFDGDGSTAGANRRWPDALAERLQRDADGARYGVLNEGIIGNRLLKDSPREPPSKFGDALGESAISRLERDALAQPNVRCIIAHVGGNDIAFPGVFTPSAAAVTAADLIAGLRRLVASAHARGMRIVGTTLTPFENATLAPGFYTPEKEAVRQAVNAWMRNSRDFDAVVDVDRVVGDPEHPARLLPAYDSGDHLHANDAGYAAAARAIELSALFKERGREGSAPWAPAEAGEVERALRAEDDALPRETEPLKGAPLGSPGAAADLSARVDDTMPREAAAVGQRAQGIAHEARLPRQVRQVRDLPVGGDASPGDSRDDGVNAPARRKQEGQA